MSLHKLRTDGHLIWIEANPDGPRQTVASINSGPRQAEWVALFAAAPALLEACRAAARLYSQIELDTNPLACASAHGPDYSPPTAEEWEAMCTDVRESLATAIAAAGGEKA